MKPLQLAAVGVGGVITLGAGAHAHAQDTEHVLDTGHILSPGFAVVFDHDPRTGPYRVDTWRVGIGTDISFNPLVAGDTLRWRGDNGDPIAWVGGVLQLEIFFNGDVRVGAGVQGVSMAPLPGVGSELGVSLRFADGEAIPGIQLNPFVSAGVVYASGRFIFEGEHTLKGVSVGLKSPMKVDRWEGLNGKREPTGGIDGRPLRDAEGRIVRPDVVFLGDAAVLDDAVQERAGLAWLDSGRDEHSAIAAFARLSVHLERLGAPGELVLRAQHAAQQEAEHADRCFAIASRLLGQTVAPIANVVPVGPTPTLAALARDNFLDGRLNEGAAAAQARAALERVQDADARQALEQIADEEASHASLADDIERWLLDQGGDDVSAALAQARSGAPTSIQPRYRAPDAPDDQARWARWGLLDAQAQRDAFDAQRRALGLRT